MNEIIRAAIELVREGGAAAIWIVVVHYFVGLIKFVIGMGIIGYVVSKICKLIKHAVDVDAEI